MWLKKNVYRSSCKVPVILTDFNEILIFFFEKCSNNKFHENPSSGSRVVPCGRTGMTKLILRAATKNVYILIVTQRSLRRAQCVRFHKFKMTFGFYFKAVYLNAWRPPLWSSGQSFWLQIERSRVRFPALPDFLSSSGSGTGFTQSREVNWGATWIKSSGCGLENRD